MRVIKEIVVLGGIIVASLAFTAPRLLAGWFETCEPRPTGPELHNTCQFAEVECLGECYTLTRIGCGACYPGWWWCSTLDTQCIVNWVYGECSLLDGCECLPGQGPGEDKTSTSCEL